MAAVVRKALMNPSTGIVLTDTFNLHTGRKGFPKFWLPDNSEASGTSTGPADSGYRGQSTLVGGTTEFGG